MTGAAVGPRGGGLREVNMIAQNTEHKSHLTAVKAGVSTNRWVQRKSLALVNPQMESQNSITDPVPHILCAQVCAGREEWGI